MATPLLWTRQPDTIGVLGLAINTCAERNGHADDVDRIRELLEAARDLWAVDPDARGRGRAAAADPADAPADPHRRHRGGHCCLSLIVNDHSYEVHAEVGTTLAEALRDELSLTGTKIACGEGHCGACTVLVDGVPTLSCITLVHSVGGAQGDDDRGAARPSDGARVRARGRTAMRLLHAGADRQRRRARRRDAEPDHGGDPTRAWPATSAAAARIRRSRRRFARGKTDPHREGSRRPLRGGLARRRRGRARAVARRPARDRRPAGDAHRRPRARARRGRVHRRPAAAGDAAHRRAALAVRARSGRAHRPRAGARAARRACSGRAGRRSTCSIDECGFQGAAVAAVCADTLRAGARGASRDRGRLRAARGADRPR